MLERKKLTALEKRKLLEDGLLPDEIDRLEIQLDPVVWAETYLRDPEKPNRPLKVRWYQSEMLRCENKKKVFRCGRRVGKSIVLCIEMLWKAFCRSDSRILVCTPYKNQTQVLWKDGFNKLIKGNEYMEASISRMTSNPYAIEFKNGSRILGLTAGSKTGNKGGSIRGQNASDLYLDEVDYMGDEAIQSIMAIIATAPDAMFVISSTPTGKREFFYDACVNPNLGYREFHYASSVSPTWISIKQAEEEKRPLHESHEYLFRSQYGEHEYNHEFMAEFSEESQGVFKHKYITDSLVEYENEEADPRGLNWFCGEKQDPENVYALGVDWNGDKVGTQLVLVEYCKKPTEIKIRQYKENAPGDYTLIDGVIHEKYRVFYRESISVENMTQTESIKKIIELNSRFHIDHIYVDAGFGSTNIEELKLYGMKNKASGILSKLKAIDFASHLYVHDPYSKEDIKKAVKPFMVYNAQARLENNQLVLPDTEDEKVRLVGQMREYRIEKISPLGVPQFSKENDHILDAFMLALLAFQMEYSELIHVKYSNVVSMTNKPTMLVSGLDSVPARDFAKQTDKLQSYGIPKRGPVLGANKYHQKNPRASHSGVDYEDVVKSESTSSPFATKIDRSGWARHGAPQRTSF